MTFDDITENGKLWAVRFNGEPENELSKLFAKWNDTDWLRSFFIENIDDLSSYFKIMDITQAVKDTIEDSDELECVFLDLSPEADLSMFFRPLSNSETSDVMLQKEKARLKRRLRHSSWLRLYAIKLVSGVYIITGGAIKLTATMQEREHTRNELIKLEKVRRYLLEENITDDIGFMEYLND